MHQITCPSGLTGVIRKLKAKEADYLADPKMAKSGRTTEEILKSVWMETLDPGPYTVNAQGGIDWDKALVADRFYALLQIRILTYGSDYIFKVRCQHCPATIEWQLDLSSLDLAMVPEATLRAYQAGSQLTTKLLDGRTCTYHVQTGTSERRAQALLRQTHGQSMVLTSLQSQVDSIDGIEKAKLRAVLEDLDMDEVMHLIKVFDEASGGVETDVPIECPECFADQVTSAPFHHSQFWLPKSRSPKG